MKIKEYKGRKIPKCKDCKIYLEEMNLENKRKIKYLMNGNVSSLSTSVLFFRCPKCFKVYKEDTP